MQQAASLFTVAVVLAVVVEALIEYVKELKSGKFTVEQGIAIVLGLLLAFGAKLDLFQMIEVQFSIPYVGTVIVGLCISKGAGWLHDVFDRILKAKGGEVKPSA